MSSRKPQYNTPILKSALPRGATFGTLLNHNFAQDFITNKIPTRRSTPNNGVVASSYGMGLDCYYDFYTYPVLTWVLPLSLELVFQYNEVSSGGEPYQCGLSDGFLGFDTAGKPYVKWYTGAGYTTITAATAATVGARYHLVCIASATSGLSLYVNGVLAAQNAGVTPSTNGATTSITLGTNDNPAHNILLSALATNGIEWNESEVYQRFINTYRFCRKQKSSSRAFLAPVTGIQFGTAGSSGDVAAANTWSGSVSWADPNRALGIDVSMLGPGVTVTSMTYGGAACTFVGAISTVTSFGRVEQWRITAADSGAPAVGSNTLVVNLSGSIEFAVNWASYTGVHQTVPTEGFNSAQATNGAGAVDASVAITSIADNTLIHAAVVASDTSITANQTTRNNVSGTLGSGADENSNAVITPPGATTMSYTGVGAFVTWAMAGFAWRPVAASGGATRPVKMAGFWSGYSGSGGGFAN